MTPEQLAKSGTEHAEQMALFCWANAARRWGFDAANNMRCYSGDSMLIDAQFTQEWPCLDWLHAIPNAGARGNKVAASQLKAEGVKAGVADIFLPMPTMRYGADKLDEVPCYWWHGLYIELKRANGVPSDVSAEQIKFAKFANENSYAWYPAFGWREAARLIQEYIKCETITLTPKQAQVLRSVEAE